MLRRSVIALRTSDSTGSSRSWWLSHSIEGAAFCDCEGDESLLRAVVQIRWPSHAGPASDTASAAGLALRACQYLGQAVLRPAAR